MVGRAERDEPAARDEDRLLARPAQPATRQTGTIGHADGNTDDTKHRLNRTGNYRPIPPDDPDFGRLYRRPNDAESITRHLDDTLWLRRAHSIGQYRRPSTCSPTPYVPTDSHSTSTDDDNTQLRHSATGHEPHPPGSTHAPQRHHRRHQPSKSTDSGAKPGRRDRSPTVRFSRHNRSTGLRRFSPRFSTGPAQIAQSVEQRTRNA